MKWLVWVCNKAGIFLSRLTKYEFFLIYSLFFNFVIFGVWWISDLVSTDIEVQAVLFSADKLMFLVITQLQLFFAPIYWTFNLQFYFFFKYLNSVINSHESFSGVDKLGHFLIVGTALIYFQPFYQTFPTKYNSAVEAFLWVSGNHLAYPAIEWVEIHLLCHKEVGIKPCHHFFNGIILHQKFLNLNPY